MLSSVCFVHSRGDSAKQEKYLCLFISKAAELPPSMIAYKYGSLAYLCSRSQSCVVCFALQAEERKKNPQKPESEYIKKGPCFIMTSVIPRGSTSHYCLTAVRFNTVLPPTHTQ